MNKEKILNFLSYMVGLITIIIVMLFHNNIGIALLASGCGASFYGFINMLKKNNYGIVIFSIGINLFIAMLLYKINILDRFNSITFMICGSIFALMSFTLVFMNKNKKEVIKEYSMNVVAEVVDLVKNPNTKKEYYQVVYQYVIDKNTYTVGTPNYVNKFIPKIGDKIMLRVDPNDYTSVFFDKSKMNKIYDDGLVIGLLVVSFIIIVSLFF